MEDYSKLINDLRGHLLSISFKTLHDAADAIETLSQQKTTILLKPNEKRPLHECAACGWYFSDGDVKDFNYCPCCGRKIEKDDETIQDALKEMRIR